MAKRDYKAEYAKHQSSPKAIKDRTSRNAARTQAVKSGIVKKGDGKDVDHKDGNPRNNAKGNLRAMSQKQNRGRNNNK